MIYQSISISLLSSSLIVYRPVWCNSHLSYHFVSLLIPTLTLKHYCIWAIVTGLTLLMSRNKSLVLLMFLVLVLLLLIPLYYLGHVHRICTTYILTDPPPPVSCTTIVSMVTGKTALFSLMLHCFFHPKQLSPLISNTNTLSESRCTTYIQVRLS